MKTKSYNVRSSTSFIARDKENLGTSPKQKYAEIPKTQTSCETKSQHTRENSHTGALPTPSMPLLCPARPLALIPI